MNARAPTANDKCVSLRLSFFLFCLVSNILYICLTACFIGIRNAFSKHRIHRKTMSFRVYKYGSYDDADGDGDGDSVLANRTIYIRSTVFVLVFQLFRFVFFLYFAICAWHAQQQLIASRSAIVRSPITYFHLLQT